MQTPPLSIKRAVRYLIALVMLLCLSGILDLANCLLGCQAMADTCSMNNPADNLPLQLEKTSFLAVEPIAVSTSVDSCCVKKSESACSLKKSKKESKKPAAHSCCKTDKPASSLPASSLFEQSSIQPL